MTQRQLHYQENDTIGDNDSQELSAQLAGNSMEEPPLPNNCYCLCNFGEEPCEFHLLSELSCFCLLLESYEPLSSL